MSSELVGLDHWSPAVETHEAWKRRRILEGQRFRRQFLRRIEYHPSKEAAAIIDGEAGPFADGTYSAVIDRIVCEWAAELPE